MTDIDLYREQSAVLASDVATRRLAEWANSAQSAHVVSEQLVKTSFVPDSFRGKPYEATAAILAGLEVGLSPMAALRSFDVIQGQAAPRAITLRAIVQAQGHEMVMEESTATRCKMRGKRRGTNEWQTVTWTTDRAKSLNLLGKQNWRQQPQAMLIARATSELARLVAADAILGIAYSVEEIADGAGAGVETPAATAPPAEPAAVGPSGTRRMSRTKRTTPDDSDVQDAEVIDTPTLSDAQMKKLRALYNSLGVTGAAEQKKITAHLLGVDTIATHSTLTVDQASHVIDQLARVEDGTATFELNDDAEIIGITDTEPDPAEADPTLDLDNEGEPE